MKRNDLNRTSFIDWFLGNDGAISFAVVILGFIFGTIIVLLVGKNPINMYKSLLYSMIGRARSNGGWNFRYIGETLNYSIPFVLCGFAMAFAYRVGLFNVGGEGQYIMGMTAAQTVALLLPPFPGQWVVCLLAAIMAGAIWGGIVGLLKARFKVSEVVATIMLNYIALYLSRLICLQHPGATTYNTAALPATSKLAKFLIPSSNLNIGFFFMLAAVFIYWFVMEKTKAGFAFRATGYNQDAARCSGIPVVRSISVSMAVAGAFAGLAGALVLLGGAYPKGRIIVSMDNYGFNGMAVALVGNCRAIGTLLAGLLFGVMKQSQSLMQDMDIPKEITYIIQGLIVVFIALRAGLQLVREYRAKRIVASKVASV
ncbi:MAG: ABC transporter permease [Sphaerochaetaceae bacterium]|jgi:ABC-type uncharacterized transport system permease subunit|nr:ABC transporter permease [Sphaerochaetaceae bacterium]